MGIEYRIGGPPGTGKTTWLAKEIARAAEARGPENILVTSFTRAAAAELVGRDLPIPRENVGTLHALCYRALDRPTIAETKIAEWNENTPSIFQLSDKGDERNLDDPLAEHACTQNGDEIMRRYQLMRNKLVDKALWPEDVVAFDTRWTDWKEQTGYEDFTGMLERARDFYGAPGRPQVICLDECQDCVPLQWSLIRKWAAECDMLITAGDDDQLLYDFVGASPDFMLDPPVPPEQTRTLHQSYRVPRAVLDLSQRWIKQVKRRWPKEYNARMEDGQEVMGSVARVDTRWRDGDSALRVIDGALERGHSIMILASCAYMLGPILASLRRHGLAFFNPYRKANGSWNPLHASRGVSVRERLLAYLRPKSETWGEQARWWTWKDVHAWGGMLKVKDVFKKGGQGRLDVLAKDHGDESASIEQLLAEIFEEQAFERVFEQDLDWLKSNLLAARAHSAEFPLTIMQNRGSKALLEEPKIIVGTVHSAKGGEAGEVLLFPDLSRQGLQQWLTGGEGADAIRRVMYVGMTRTKWNLHLAAPSIGGMAVNWEV